MWFYLEDLKSGVKWCSSTPPDFFMGKNLVKYGKNISGEKKYLETFTWKEENKKYKLSLT